MKRLLLLITIPIAFSCKQQDVQPTVDIHSEWKWFMTSFDTRGKAVTAQELDTTYYYRFTREGQFEMLDESKALEQQVSYTIVNDESFNRIVLDELDLIWGYSIRNDTLVIWEPTSIFPRKDYFKKN